VAGIGDLVITDPVVHFSFIYAIEFAALCGPCQDWGMRVVSCGGSLTRRLITVALVVFGLLGMHHMVSVSCSAVFQEHGAAHSLYQVDGLMVAGPALPETSTVPDLGIGTHPQQSHWGLDCLAILFVVSLGIPVVRRISLRRRSRPSPIPTEDQHFPFSDPPDLRCLSISRT
jgi:hypothetical protein